MMIKNVTNYLFPLAVLTVFLAPGVLLAGLVGEPAPALNVREWEKGGPVTIKPGTNVYLVEIMETKLAGSRSSFTNLNEWQARFGPKGLVVVAVSDEPTAIVRDFVQHNSSNMDFAVAADNGRHTALAFMKPVSREGIPYEFIIGTNGDLLWHGVPQPGVNQILDRITSGRYDEAVAAKMDLTGHQMQQYIALARQGSDRAQTAGRIMLAARTNDISLLCEMAYVICTTPRLTIRDFSLADEALTEAERIAPTNSAAVTMGRAIWLFESGKRNQGLDRAREVLAESTNPVEKTNLQVIVTRMEARMKAFQARTANTAPDGAGGTSGQGANNQPK